MDIGSMLRSLRAREGLTLKSAAKVIQISMSRLSAIERGEVSPRIDVVEKIVQGYGYNMRVSFVGKGTNIYT